MSTVTMVDYYECLSDSISVFSYAVGFRHNVTENIKLANIFIKRFRFQISDVKLKMLCPHIHVFVKFALV